MEVRVANTIEAFDRGEWNRLFPGELEDHAYYLAVEKSSLPDFEWLYFGVYANGALRAAVPAFITDYELDTTLTGLLRRVSDALSRVFPRLLKQRLLSLGSPVGEVCHLGFAADCGASEQQQILAAVLTKMESVASERRVAMLAAKDTANAQDVLWAQSGDTTGLRRQPGLPTAVLDLPFTNVDEYLATLSRATRKDLRRKLKAGEALRVEWRDNIDDIRDEVLRLYRETYTRAELSFEELTPEYFTSVLRECAGRALCATYWAGDRLIAFNLVLHDGERLIDKFLGMDYAVAREYNLYFYTWIENVRWCIAHGIKVYQSGQGLHREKLRLGSRLDSNWLWYRHRNPLLDRIFASLEQLARLDRNDDDLAALKPSAPAEPEPPRSRLWIAWLALIGCEMLCQIALKYAGHDTGEFDFSLAAFTRALRSPWLWTAIGTYVGGFLAWMLILRKSRLSQAFPTSAIVFVGVMFSSWLVLGETVSWTMLAGAVLITGGILLLGSESDEVQSPPAIPEHHP